MRAQEMSRDGVSGSGKSEKKPLYIGRKSNGISLKAIGGNRKKVAMGDCGLKGQQRELSSLLEIAHK